MPQIIYDPRRLLPHPRRGNLSLNGVLLRPLPATNEFPPAVFEKAIAHPSFKRYEAMGALRIVGEPAPEPTPASAPETAPEPAPDMEGWPVTLTDYNVGEAEQIIERLADAELSLEAKLQQLRAWEAAEQANKARKMVIDDIAGAIALLAEP